MKTKALTTTSSTAATLRARLAHFGPRGVGQRYPEGFRGEVLDYLAAQRERGIGLPATARELGLREKTMWRWLAQGRAEAGPAEFREVEVVECAPPAAVPLRPVLHAPGGLRVEGLDITSLAELLRRLA
jgi:hypothetical protein